MKYLRLFETNDDEIVSICRNYHIKRFFINSDRSINVSGDVDLSRFKIDKLPLKFDYVSGGFHCNVNNLETLEGSPWKLGGDFNCQSNKLVNLHKGPKEVGNNFVCSYNKLLTLEGGPYQVGKNYDCSYNSLSNLKGCVKRVPGFFICMNNRLISTEGAPTIVNGSLKLDDIALPHTFKNSVKNLLKNKLIYKMDIYKLILKYQNDYSIWIGDKLDKNRFFEMMQEIEREF